MNVFSGLPECTSCDFGWSGENCNIKVGYISRRNNLEAFSTISAASSVLTTERVKKPRMVKLIKGLLSASLF